MDAREPPFPEAGLPGDDVLEEMRALRDRDVSFASGRILGSMCTAPHPVGVEAYKLFLETNLGDPALCAGARESEERALALLKGLLHAPPDAGGVFVSGGSEANFTALRIHAKRSGRRTVVLPETAHFSFDKALDYLNLRTRVVRARPDWTTDPDAVADAITKDTACVVAIAGTTEHGSVDPIPEIAAICRDAGVPLHVDAAWGGFVLPFARDLGVDVPDFDFLVPGVDTLTVDPHKMGMAPIPAGVLLTRSTDAIRAIGIPSPYVSVERQPTIQGTRPGAAPAAAYAVMRHLGRAGYRAVVAECLDTTAHLARELMAMGLRLAREPHLNLVSFHVKDPIVSRRILAEKGFLVSLAPLSRGLKIVVMPHVTREAVDAFLPALRETCEKTGDI